MSRLIYRVGYNSQRHHKATSNGRPTEAYDKWHQMMQRCYSKNNQTKNPSYIGCTVAEEWHDFQAFADWFFAHKHKDSGYQLDKDLLFPENKIYSPETCCLVPRELNSLLISCTPRAGCLPRGVYFNKEHGRHKAQLMIDGKKTHLGYFDCADSAYQAYKETKERYVKNKALEWANRIEWDVFVALMNWEIWP